MYPAVRFASLTRLYLLSSAFVTAASLAPAQVDERGFAKITHVDVSEAYLRFDRAMLANPPVGDRIVDLAEKWDFNSQLLFWNLYADAIRGYDLLAFDAAGVDPVPLELQAVASLKTRIEPPISRPDDGLAPEATFVSYYPVEGLKPESITMALRVVDPAGKSILEKEIRLAPAPKGQVNQREPLFAAGALPPVGTYQIELRLPNLPPFPPCKWTVSARSHDALREGLRARLASAKADTPALVHAVGLAKSRTQLLGDRPSEFRDAQYFADPLKLAAEIESEVAAIERGENPYKGKTGEYWRVVRDEAGTGTAMRLAAPPQAAHGKPLPLVIALPGTGGDENSFFDGFGQGLLAKLAFERGFLALSSVRDTFDIGRALDSIRIDYEVDPERIYLLGHSHGADVSAIISRQRPDLVAAIVCLAGGAGFYLYPSGPPALVITADNDHFCPYERFEAQVGKARALGARVEIRVVRGTAHSLTVSRELPAAIDWLFARKLASPPPPKPTTQ